MSASGMAYRIVCMPGILRSIGCATPATRPAVRLMRQLVALKLLMADCSAPS
jgi:hypothetical protein